MATDSLNALLAVRVMGSLTLMSPADVNGGIVGADGRDKGHEQDVGRDCF